jgi:hypothetical protein
VALNHASHIRRRRYPDSRHRTLHRYHAERVPQVRVSASPLGFPFGAAFLIAGITILLALLLF